MILLSDILLELQDVISVPLVLQDMLIVKHFHIVSCASVFTHAVNWSVREETISSKPDKISSLEKGNSTRSGKGLSCLGWMTLHLGRKGGSLQSPGC